MLLGGQPAIVALLSALTLVGAALIPVMDDGEHAREHSRRPTSTFLCTSGVNI
jgi:hypothetical protein